MTRIFAVALVCAAMGSIGCSSMRTSGPLARNSCQGESCHIAASQQAPRPLIERTACHQPVGVMDLPSPQGCGPGCGCFGGNGYEMVNGCVSAIADCNGGYCGDSCGNGNCGEVYGHPGHCTCGQSGRCACCQKMRAMAARGHAMGRAAVDMTLDPRACMTDAAYNFNPGPPSAQTAYPYYTTRSPRDFLNPNPPSIGPY